MFYARFGFVAVPWQELPQPLKLKFSLSALAAKLFHIPVNIMQYRELTTSEGSENRLLKGYGVHTSRE
jgi:hypothetical protein